MFTMRDMLYFTMPNPTALDAEGKLFVTDTAYDRNSSYAGTIVDIKDGITLRNGTAWRTTTDGSYVTGHGLKREPFYRQNLVGTVDGIDSMFFFGTLREVDHDGKLVLVSAVQNSLAKYPVPSLEGAYGNQIRLNNWTQAAPWTQELMPRTGDSTGTIQAKLALAKAKWETNRAVMEMAHEGYQRHWTTELKSLHENPELDFLPRPRLGVTYTGEVLLPAAQSAAPALSEEQRTKIQALRSRSLSESGVVTHRPKIPVSVVIPLDLVLDPEDTDLLDVTLAVKRKAQQVLKDPEISLGQHSLSYFVNGLSALL